MEEKTPAQQLREALLYQKKNGWDVVDETTEKAIFEYCEGYKTFLDRGKTERTCVDYTVELAQAAGFVPFERGMELVPGTKVYRVNRGRAIDLAIIGSAPLDQGVSIAASHIDSPRLDLKPSPLYEDSELAFLKTHYYGGIRKYQWVTLPPGLGGGVGQKGGAVGGSFIHLPAPQTGRKNVCRLLLLKKKKRDYQRLPHIQIDSRDRCLS